ncbi:MAG: nucleotidyltransferase family protein [Acidobacteria bacterium]|nr:nucleotidyltransferase family protein [Acidobacteriota bacterium]
MTTLPITVPQAEIAEICKQYHVKRLSLFGSVLTDRFRPESDIDMLVEFVPGSHPTLFTVVGMEEDLGSLLGRKVDVRTKEDLSRFFRDEVVRNALPIYE